MRFLHYTAVVVLLYASCAAAQNHPLHRNELPIGDRIKAVALFDNTDLDSSALNDFISDYIEENHIPGLSASVIQDGDIIWTGSFGNAYFNPWVPVSDSTLFMLASITKTVTGTALMQLYEQGLFELHDPVNDYLPFEVHHPQYPNTDITFFMLLTHTSGIRDNWSVMPYYPGDSPIPLGEYLEDYLVPGGAYYHPILNFTPWQPGTNYEYCNNAIALVGYLVEILSGIHLEDYCQANLFPLVDMHETSYFLANLDSMHVAMPFYWNGNVYVSYGHFGYSDYPSGQLRTSAPQLLQFLTSYMQWGTYLGNTVLDSATVAMMTQPQIPAIDPTQGLIWYSINLGGRQLWGHGGGDAGVSTEMYMCREENSGVVILTNGETYFYDLMDLLFDYASYNNAALAVNLTPHSPPIQIPGMGGDFEFDVSIENSGTDPLTFDVWFDVQLPSGMVTGPILQRDDITLPAGNTISRENLTQSVPGNAPPGDYAYVAKVGQYPAILVASDTIYFEKFIGDDIGISDAGWALSGWDIEQISGVTNPTDYVVFDAYPNPFNATTVISYKIEDASNVRLDVYDISGCNVASLVDGWYESGTYQINFSGEILTSGIYFAKFEAGSHVQTQKLLLVK